MHLRLAPIVLCLLLACSNGPDDAGQADAAPGQADAALDQADAGSSGAVDCQINPALQWDLLVEVVQLKSADGTKCVVIERRNDCPPKWICRAVPFTILEARIGADGVVHTQTDPAALSWEGTWHNWSDYGEIDVDGVHYRLQYTFGQPGKYELIATDLDSGAAMWSAVLDPVNPR